MKHPEQTKDEAIRLRIQEQMGLKTISEKLGVSKGTASLWLRNYPLANNVVAARLQESGKRRKGSRKAPLQEVSEIYRIVNDQQLTRLQIGKISETAVALRLLIRGFNVFGSMYDGDKTDWLVEIPLTRKIWKIQVKTARRLKSGEGYPTVSLRHSCYANKGSRRYNEGDFDFIVGYDIYADTAYVWSWDEVSHLRTEITVCPDAKERWDKLG